MLNVAIAVSFYYEMAALHHHYRSGPVSLLLLGVPIVQAFFIHAASHVVTEEGHELFE
jgi:Na+/glutamate symporter